MAGTICVRALASVALAALVVGAAPARAGLFDDDEARRAILDIRKQLDQGREQTARQGEQITALSAQVEQLKRSILELNGNIEAQRADNAKVRGQMEELARVVAEMQRKQLDLQQGVDERIRKVEPQKVTVDDKEFTVDPDEKRTYDDSLAGFKRGEFDHAATGFSGLLKRFPNSGYRQSALFWLGNAQYGQRNYKDAITTFRQLVTSSPDSPRAPEALLAIANCQAELKDPKAARRTIDELLSKYPKSEAAQAGRERLASLK
ncbi:MAG: tol-pal system protein YbgF [Rhizobacter sp.]|nr:tol-pal system protein YbgF [Rhizobacter sp.]